MKKYIRKQDECLRSMIEELFVELEDEIYDQRKKLGDEIEALIGSEFDLDEIEDLADNYGFSLRDVWKEQVDNGEIYSLIFTYDTEYGVVEALELLLTVEDNILTDIDYVSGIDKDMLKTLITDYVEANRDEFIAEYCPEDEEI